MDPQPQALRRWWLAARRYYPTPFTFRIGVQRKSTMQKERYRDIVSYNYKSGNL